jgi:16S rRNA (cytosine1407-C5)-methyltransferase|tara:strand:- start:1386 stop:2390 length:1005 start_codon:yes stop_codon:yes gene_type:complete
LHKRFRLSGEIKEKRKYRSMAGDSKYEALFRERLAEIVGEDRAADIRTTMARPKRQGFWVNPLADGGIPDGELVEGMPGLYSVAPAERENLTSHPAAQSGRVYLINPSSVLAVAALDVRPGHEVLDLAAAPGGKTLLLAAAMHNSGRIAAVEPRKARFHRMCANLGRCGVTNVEFYLADGRGVGRKTGARFDRVLLDAPCSSEARIRWDEPDSYEHWKPRKVKESARKQRGLLRSALTALKPGGVMVYCTCSFAPEENEQVVTGALGAYPDVDIEPVSLPDGVASMRGLPQWRGRVIDARLALAVRVLPDSLWDGLFVVRLRKKAGIRASASDS